MGLHSGEADWVAGLSFANVSIYFVTFITLNTDTDTDTGARSRPGVARAVLQLPL